MLMEYRGKVEFWLAVSFQKVGLNQLGHGSAQRGA